MPPDGWALVQFAIETGLGQLEQFGLRWDYADLENGIVSLPMPKQGERHEVPLTDVEKTILRSLESFYRVRSFFLRSAIRTKPSV
jgi:integrase